MTVLTLAVMCLSCDSQVPVEVRDANQEKLDSLEMEKGNLQRALEGFKSLSASE